jgi:hypothetical protein
MISINIRPPERRKWEYYLQKKFKSRAKLEKLVHAMIIQAVAEETEKELALYFLKGGKK